MTPRNFRLLLADRWNQGKFVCVGLDTDPDKIPATVKARSLQAKIYDFNCRIVEATHACASAYKPNIAFYAAYGETGFRALDQTLDFIRKMAPDVPVILDAKRADIGKTNHGYVKEAFSVLDADAVTVHPYLGEEAMEPFLSQVDKGVFVLCRTSNPGAGEFQDLSVVFDFEKLAILVGNADEANDLSSLMGWRQTTGGYHVPFYQCVALRVSRHWNKNSNCGLVVGATFPEELAQVRKLVGDMPILIPGIGTQGGDVEKTVRAGKNSYHQGMIINSSSGLIFPSNDAEASDFAGAAHRKLEGLNQSILNCLEGR